MRPLLLVLPGPGLPGHHTLRLGAYALAWYDGGGHVPSHLVVRWRGRIVAVLEASST